MAKKQNDSKIAVAGTITLGLALAGVIFVNEPLKSMRPPPMAGDLKPHVTEGMVPARLWEDPLEAANRVTKSEGTAKKRVGDAQDDVDRVRALRDELDRKINKHPKLPITVLLVMTEGGASGESRETRIRDRYAIGSALGVACYVPEREDRLSYIDWQDRTGLRQVVPYEWYEQGPRKCSRDRAWAQTVLIMWINGDVTGDHPISALQRLTQSILCKEGTLAACLRKHNGIVDLDVQRKKSVRFKIVGPRSSSAFRTLLEESAGAVQGYDKALVWASTEDQVELYSPWATATPKLLTHGITLSADPPDSAACKSADAGREQLCRILLWSGIEIKHGIGSDDQLFESLIHELERRRVKFQRDAVILIAEWDSFYGRVMPVEFTARVCHRIAQRSLEENRAIPPERLARIRDNCSEIHQAIDLQLDDPIGTRGMGLNLWRYSYLRGLDGEVAGGGKADTPKGSGTKSVKNVFGELHERPVGTNQFDYAQRLAARIERDMAEEANWQKVSAEDDPASTLKHERPEHQPPAAIGILGSDAYDALLILQAMRERFPGVIFFTTDLDGRLLFAEDYRSTRNLVIASHYGLELYQDLQRDVPPFRSGYQTSAYLATLQAIGYVQPLTVCPPVGGPLTEASGPLVSPCGYKANRLPDHVWFNNRELPRLFEVGRHGGVDLSVGSITEGYTLHPPRVDLSNNDPQTDGRRPGSGVVYGTAGLIYLTILVIGWTKPTINRWMTAHLSAIVLGAAGAAVLAILIDQWLLEWVLRHHDAGEPFYWFEGVSVWPTELLRALATMLALLFMAKAWHDLQQNMTTLEARYGFSGSADKPQASGWRHYLDSALWVLSPHRSNHDESVGALWRHYREAGSGQHRLPRLLLLVGIYVGTFFLLWKVMGAEDLTGPCRGELSCRLDLILALASNISLVALNIFVLDAVLLCRRWIGLLAKAGGSWSYILASRLPLLSDKQVVHAQELMRIELIAQRTEVVNRMVRYPFLVLLLMILARNEYFDDWHFPLTFIAGWVVNALLAMGAALLLYRAAEEVRDACVGQLNRQVLQRLSLGPAGEADVNVSRQIIQAIEAVGQGAFVPLYQQPVVESSLYGLVALVQHLYLK
ncbi:MAG: hypothetical protein ACT4PN_06955 [Nitrospiraceae bacterium]